jgi:DNA-binding CsgD family transcriptional regulator
MLTERELKILALLGGGNTVSRIADLLKTSGHAVENDKRRIYRKLDVTGQSHAVARAAALGILGRPPSHAYPDPEPVLPVVRLRGLSSDANQAAAVAMLTAGISFCIENGMSSHQSSWWNAWHGGPQLMVVVEPTTADPSMCANARLPVVLVEPGPARQAGMSGPPHRGAVPVISIDRVAEDLVPAIQLAAREFDRRDTGGGAWVGREVGGPEPESHHDHLPELTARESDILRSIACGHTVRQTARWLGIAAKTVENTQARLFRKLGARNRAGALAIAHGIGLVDPAEPDPPPAGLATRREVRQPTHAGQH